ncbi:Hpt domain-containing protein [Roseibium aggregatum]|uniref:Hpt domain-containing protein n=1 Tax=Roseibium aggregatum TaxID=187304 RepID=UPI001E4AA542|nr:Hpt domain-containing protein [Roseibium aggregatum]
MAPSSMARVAGRAGPEAPIDLVQLATNTLGNRDLEVQVLHLFKSQSISTLERLKQETDNSVRFDLVHTLKGSARAIGAERVAIVCENLEGKMRSSTDTATEGLIAAVDEANRYIRDLLEG